jgi:hypothetical protein
MEFDENASALLDVRFWDRQETGLTGTREFHPGSRSRGLMRSFGCCLRFLSSYLRPRRGQDQNLNDRFAGQFATFSRAEKGFSKKKGLKLRSSASCRGGTRAFNGDVDYSTGIGGTAINGALSGVPTVCVVMLGWWPAEFKTVQALKGKTIAFLSPVASRILRAGDGRIRSRCGKGDEVSSRRPARCAFAR